VEGEYFLDDKHVSSLPAILIRWSGASYPQSCLKPAYPQSVGIYSVRWCHCKTCMHMFVCGGVGTPCMSVLSCDTDEPVRLKHRPGLKKMLCQADDVTYILGVLADEYNSHPSLLQGH